VSLNIQLQNTRSNLVLERIVLLNLISQLCPGDVEVTKNLRHILLEFVHSCKKKNELNNIQEIFKKVLLFGKLINDPLKELLDIIIKDNVPIEFNQYSKNFLSEQDKENLNTLLYHMVAIGKLSQAYMMAKDFGYFNKDLKILLVN
jgi:ferritin